MIRLPTWEERADRRALYGSGGPPPRGIYADVRELLAEMARVVARALVRRLLDWLANLTVPPRGRYSGRAPRVFAPRLWIPTRCRDPPRRISHRH